MILEWLGLLFWGLALVGCAFLFSVAFGLLRMLRAHRALRREGEQCEARLLARPLPPDLELPHVVVQLPTFNEGPIVERAIAAAARLDWPRDRLHVQVCDDSTDGTTAIARAAAERARAAGVDVEVLHRTNRRDFKAGALDEARARGGHEYFAIFDIDFVPAPDFLRRSMTVLIAEPRVAFVQARLEFFNTGENALTRAQMLLLDFHFGIEQATRTWANHVLPFNGTGGVWRRAAIDAAGGWRGDTLSEDWDLSYRAYMKGWRGVFLCTVTVPGELPNNLRHWISQQKRWSAGIGEVARRMIPKLIFDRSLTREERRGAFFPLGAWLGYMMFTATLFSAVAAMLLAPSLALGLVVDAAFTAMAVALFSLMLAANRYLGRRTPLGRFMLDFAVALGMAMYISWANFWSLPATLFGRRRVFMRTPKQGSVELPDRT